MFYWTGCLPRRRCWNVARLVGVFTWTKWLRDPIQQSGDPQNCMIAGLQQKWTDCLEMLARLQDCTWLRQIDICEDTPSQSSSSQNWNKGRSECEVCPTLWRVDAANKLLPQHYTSPWQNLNDFNTKNEALRIFCALLTNCIKLIHNIQVCNQKFPD
jgi:hypothetical protein